MRVFDVEQEMDIRKATTGVGTAEPGKAYTLQGHQRRKDGTAFPVEVRLSAYYIDGQKLHLGLVRDTTERKRAEDALRESEERFRALVTGQFRRGLSDEPGLERDAPAKWKEFSRRHGSAKPQLASGLHSPG